MPARSPTMALRNQSIETTSQCDRGVGGSFFGQVCTVSVGHAVSHAILLCSAPLLARIYGPADFAILGVFTAFLAILSPFLTLRFEYAFLLIRRTRHCELFAGGVLVLSGLMSVACGGMALALRGVLSGLLDVQVSAGLCWAMAAGSWTFAGFQISSMLIVRSAGFARLARQRVLYALSAVAAQITIGLWIPSPEGIVAAMAIGYGVAAAPGMPSILLTCWRYGRRAVAFQLAMMGVYRKYPRVDTFASLVSALNAHGPLILMTAVFGPAVGGAYTLAHRVLVAPSALFSYSASRVYYNRATSRRDEPAELVALFQQCSRQALLLSLIVCGVSAVFAPVVVPLVFGTEWGQAGMICAWICPLLVAQVVSTTVSPTFDVLQRQGRRLILQVLTCALLLGAFGLMTMVRNDVTSAILAMVCAGVLGHTFTILDARRCMLGEPLRLKRQVSAARLTRPIGRSTVQHQTT